MVLRAQLTKIGIDVKDIPDSVVRRSIDEVQRDTSQPRETIIRNAITMLENQACEGRMILEV